MCIRDRRNTVTGSGLATDNQTPSYIGKSPSSSSYYTQGMIDQVRVFPSALSASEVTQLYNEVGYQTKFTNGTTDTIVFKEGSGNITFNKEEINNSKKPLTIQEYYKWNENWLKESTRALKQTGAIYLICGWKHSGMYQSLLNSFFKIQTRITWRNSSPKDQTSPLTWINRTSDIWFATKSDEFMFNQEAVTSEINNIKSNGPLELGITNLWSDIMDVQIGSTTKMEGDKPEQLIQRILTASSFKLNWVLDPFARTGGIGVITKKMGRRFIGFESDQDRLLMAMKRIDNE